MTVIACALNDRPWYPLRIARTWFDFRYAVASRSAVSFASVPEVVKKTRASEMPESAAIFSASSIIGSDR